MVVMRSEIVLYFVSEDKAAMLIKQYSSRNIARPKVDYVIFLAI